jgi:hypothetical protein
MQMKDTLTHATFRGWSAYVLRRGPLVLHVVPDVGGRLMGIEFAGRELCFIHPGLEGKTFTGDAQDWPRLCGEWSFPLWGGGKTWVAPESDWPGQAPHRDLDSGAWQVLSLYESNGLCGIELQSPVCSATGLQIARKLMLEPQGSQWSIEHTLSNLGPKPVRCGIWDVLMLQRPARVSIALQTDAGHRCAPVVTRPGSKSVHQLQQDGQLQLTPLAAILLCDRAEEFKCGFESRNGEVHVEFPSMPIRYERHSSVTDSQSYAHGKAVEIFNAPSLEYFEVETHSPLQTMLPGQSMRFCIHESVGGTT